MIVFQPPFRFFAFKTKTIQIIMQKMIRLTSEKVILSGQYLKMPWQKPHIVTSRKTDVPRRVGQLHTHYHQNLLELGYIPI